MSAPCSWAARNVARPVRPKPLIPMRVDMPDSRTLASRRQAASVVQRSRSRSSPQTCSTAVATAGLSSLPGGEALALDAVDGQPRGRAPERARELERLGEADSVRRAADAPRDRRERVEAVDRPRRCARADGVDHDHLVGALPARRAGRSARPRARRTRGSSPSARATARPAASSPRNALPRPMTISAAIDLERRGSASRRRCTGRGCGSPARRGGAGGRCRGRGCRPGSRAGRPRSKPGSARSGGTILASRIVPSSSSR